MRVLVLDGGGSRGFFTLEVLRYIELSCGRPIRECFDLVVGTSIGAFIAGCIVAGRTIEEIETQFLPLASSLSKANPTVASLTTRLVWGHALDACGLESHLKSILGETTLADLPDSPRLIMLAADARTVTPHPFLIRSRPLPADVQVRSPFATSSSMRLVDAFRAAAAAPTIYPAHVVDGIPLVDAGILANNPVLFAIAEATLVGGVDCVVSIGTGVETRILHPSPHRGLLGWTWAAIRRSVDPETPDMLARGILPANAYIRFDPPRVGDCSPWEGDTDVLRSGRTTVQGYMHEQRDVLASLVPRLCPEKPGVQDNEGRSVSNPGGP
jgi:predicted acylesterase/phospholipase RssA